MFTSYNIGAVCRYINVPDAYRTGIVTPELRLIMCVQKTHNTIVCAYCNIPSIG